MTTQNLNRRPTLNLELIMKMNTQTAPKENWLKENWKYLAGLAGGVSILWIARLLMCAALLALVTMPARSQTIVGTVTGTPPVMPGPTNIFEDLVTNTPTSLGTLGEVGQATFAFLSDAQPYFGTSNAVQYTAVALYNNKRVGGLIAIGLPLTALSSSGQITVGSALGYINGQWLSLSLNASAGTTWNLPVIGKIYTAIGSGPDYNWHARQPGAYSYAEIFKGWDVGIGHILSIMGGIGYESSMSGAIYNAGSSLAF